MRTFLILSAVILFSSAARAKPAPACVAPAPAPELKLPAYTVTEKTAACDRRIDAAFAHTGKKLETFLQAQRRIHEDVAAGLDLQGGVACSEVARAYASLLSRQYAAVVKVLYSELRDEVGHCALVLPFAPTPRVPDSDETPVPEPVNPGMIEPI